MRRFRGGGSPFPFRRGVVSSLLPHPPLNLRFTEAQNPLNPPPTLNKVPLFLRPLPSLLTVVLILIPLSLLPHPRRQRVAGTMASITC